MPSPAWKTLVITALMLFAFGQGLTASGAQEYTLTASDASLPENARALQAFPLGVFPGTLVFVWGEHFGNRPVSISIGSAKISQFLLWQDNIISFRVPNVTLDSNAQLSLPSSEPIVFHQAGTNAQTVRWSIDLDKAQQILSADPRSLANDTPLHLFKVFSIKLESDVPPLPVLLAAGKNEWFTETVLESPDKPDSLAPMLFSFSLDPVAGPDARKSALILLETWAKQDPFDLISAAPAFAWGSRDPRFSSSTRLLEISFPETNSKR